MAGIQLMNRCRKAELQAVFDRYWVLDWSARSHPSPAHPSSDAIWIADATRTGKEVKTQYFRTRHQAFQHLQQNLTAVRRSKARQRVLLGVDFSLGAPSGWSDLLRLDGPGAPWQRWWQELRKVIEDHPDQSNNRFQAAAHWNAVASGGLSPGPFWGRPQRVDLQNLPTRSPTFPFLSPEGRSVARKRLVETRLPGTQELWKLMGIGSVGSQSLLGIAMCHRLRFESSLQDEIGVWPMETGFLTDRSSDWPQIVLAEVWPGVARQQVDQWQDEHPESIVDQAQVAALALHLRDLDRQQQLLGWLGPPTNLTKQQMEQVLQEEGWIAGANAIENF
jgi:hypothetical protein